MKANEILPWVAGAVFLSLLGLGITKIAKDVREENNREYQLVCTNTNSGVEVFRSSWGERIWSGDWEWYTPDGKYIQSPETLCRKYYRHKTLTNQ